MDYEDIEKSTFSWEEPLNPFEYYEENLFHSINLFIQKYLVSTIKLVLCIFVVANNGLLIFVINKFRRLQTKTNYVLLNFAVANILFSISSTVVSLMESFAFHVTYMHKIEYNIFLGAVYFFLLVSFLLASLLALDWFISANLKNILQRYQKFYKWIIALTYLIPFLINLAILILNYDTGLSVVMQGGLLSAITCCVCMLMSAVINIIKFRKTYTQELLRTAYALYISNIYILMWLPFFLLIITHLFLSLFIEYEFSVIIILTLLTYILEVIAFVAPVVIVVMLTRLDKTFKMSFDTVFKRSVQNYFPSDDNVNINED